MSMSEKWVKWERSVFSDTITETLKLFKTGLIKSNSLQAICKRSLSLCPQRKINLIYTLDGSGGLFSLVLSSAVGKSGGELQLEEMGCCPSVLEQWNIFLSYVLNLIVLMQKGKQCPLWGGVRVSWGSALSHALLLKQQYLNFFPCTLRGKVLKD